MGAIGLSQGSIIAVDTTTLIFTIERNPVFEPILTPLWEAMIHRQVQVIASELVIVETLTGDYAANDNKLSDDYEEFDRNSGIRLIAIPPDLLRAAAKLRVDTKLKTPDAIHAVTARSLRCSTFVTRDTDYRKVPGLSVTLLDDLLKP